MEESLSTDDEIGLPASRDSEAFAGGLYTGGNQGDFALAGGGEVERVSNGQVQRRTGRDVRSPTIGQPGRLNPHVGVTGLEVDGEGVVDVTVVPNLPVDGPCIVPSPEHLLGHVEILDLDQIGLRNGEPYTDCRLVAGIILAGRYNYDFIGLFCDSIRHRKQQHDGAVSSERVYSEALLGVQRDAEFPVGQHRQIERLLGVSIVNHPNLNQPEEAICSGRNLRGLWLEH